MDLAEDILTISAALVWIYAGIWVSYHDIKENILPKRIIWPATAIVLVIYIATAIVIQDVEPLFWALVGAVGGYGAFYTVYLISTNAMGGGDVRLAALNGLIVGWWGPAQPWLALAAALVLSFPSALVLVVIKGPKSSAAFGPFMVAGAALMVGLELAGVSPFSS